MKVVRLNKRINGIIVTKEVIDAIYFVFAAFHGILTAKQKGRIHRAGAAETRPIIGKGDRYEKCGNALGKYLVEFDLEQLANKFGEMDYKGYVCENNL